MGLSSSQARLLHLTTRMHQIEYKAAKLEAEKLQMANESNKVYEDYLDALDKTKIQRKKLTTDGAVTYVDISNYTDFNNSGFALVKGNVTYQAGVNTSGSESGLFKDGSTPPVVYQITKMTYHTGETQPVSGVTLNDGDSYYIQTKTSDQSVTYHQSMPTGLTAIDDSAAWTQLLDDLNLDIPHSADFETVLTNIIQSGEITIVSKNPENSVFNQPYEQEFHLFETSVATNTNLQEVGDESLLRKAEAKYEADMRKIDRKERKFDQDLATLDNERNAIKQEMDTLKTVAKENVERTFKIFS